MRKRRLLPRNIILLILAILVIGSLFWTLLSFLSPGHQAKKTVEEFYTYEQEGEFGDSWELLHSQMKVKFPKGPYVQDRAHVFMGHFGAETFSYTIDKPEKIERWKMEEGVSPLKVVYKMTVTQSYKGKYGAFDFRQYVFVTKEKGEWKILWDYKK
ncbi:hypothetical protein ACFOU2_14590 [Bacillus songklensis]|uniref:DUF4440 domain-containing protein n=1 Tax=Bacillus songklensis TaxID=1069116 RepID=A0ABV8B2X8_9BACI